MANHYYYDNNGQKQGPVSGRDIKQLALSGAITPDTLVEMENGQTVKASRISGLEFSKPAVPPAVAAAETYGVAAPPQPSAPSAPLFKYFDAEGRKQTGLTILQLQTLAKKGVITPKTIIENAAGQTTLAGNVKGLVFQQETATDEDNPFATFSASSPSGQYPQPVPIPQPRDTGKFCAACGVSLNPEQVICVKCGVAVGGAAAVPQTGYQNNAQIDYRVNVPPMDYSINVPNRNEAAEKIKSSYFGFFVSSIILLILIPVAILFMYFSDSVGVVGVGLVIVALFTIAIAVPVYMYMLLYRLWKVVPKDVAAATPGSFVFSVTPGIAVGFCFIPLFNIYWLFVVWYGLGKNLNRTLAGRRQSYRVSERIRLTSFILNCCCIIPYVNVLTSIAAFVFFLIYLNSLKNGAVALLEGKA